MADKLSRELAKLSTLDREVLAESWQKFYGTEPPSGMSKVLIAKAVAYKMQEKIYGGLRPASKRYLEKDLTEQKSPPAITAKAGTKLLREWNGVVHEVIIQNGGVLYNGKRHQSLTEVAKLITGIHRSGPQFFGLHRKQHGGK